VTLEKIISGGQSGNGKVAVSAVYDVRAEVDQLDAAGKRLADSNAAKGHI